MNRVEAALATRSFGGGELGIRFHLRLRVEALAGPPIRLLVASDVRLYTEGLSARLATVPGIRVEAVAMDAAALETELGRGTPDVVLMDMSMPGSLAAARAIRRRTPHVPVVGLAVAEVEDVVIPCIEAGVVAYLPRHGTLEDLLQLVTGVARGDAFASPHILATLFRRLSYVPDRGAAASTLSAREMQIAGLLERGCSNKQIAKELDIRVPTVKKHVHSILGKLQVQRRWQVGETLREQRRCHWRSHIPVADLDGGRSTAVAVDVPAAGAGPT